MKKKIFLISKPSLSNIIKEIFFDFDVCSINFEDLSDRDFKNKNILIIDIQKLKTHGGSLRYFISTELLSGL